MTTKPKLAYQVPTGTHTIMLLETMAIITNELFDTLFASDDEHIVLKDFKYMH